MRIPRPALHRLLRAASLVALVGVGALAGVLVAGTPRAAAVRCLAGSSVPCPPPCEPPATSAGAQAVPPRHSCPPAGTTTTAPPTTTGTTTAPPVTPPPAPTLSLPPRAALAVRPQS